MFELNLPETELNIRELKGKNYIFDPLRKQFVRFSPEEYVRQLFTAFLKEHKDYPQNRMANEIEIALGNVRRRCDTVVYDEFLQPLMIIEYKAPSVAVSQTTFDQICRYNMSLNVKWLIVSNGLKHYCCRIDPETQTYSFLSDVPKYGDLKLS
ncbi:MAG: type I restriction enzyme HsdR N-terminal domain-containing protein [Dysgonamonadaceae bacterium]|jgi:type I site-specific restriction-modification system R (restriction) subunit|nr:type I restriction enzyme HsdR N-terminal domain-containing protein [Dysgonamonadaceae bacterium]